MNTVSEVGQAVRDIRFKKNCPVHEAATQVLRSAKAVGGFGDEFLLASILHAERSLVTRRTTPAPQKGKFAETVYDHLDMEIPVPEGGRWTGLRKRVGDLTRADTLEISHIYDDRAKQARKMAKVWADLSDHIPENKTLGDVWGKVPSRIKKRLLS